MLTDACQCCRLLYACMLIVFFGTHSVLLNLVAKESDSERVEQLASRLSAG